MAADYSHIRNACLPGFAKRLAAGWQPYDEYLFEAVESMSPPLLDDTLMDALRRLLCPPKRSRGGQRKESIGRLELAEMVVGAKRTGAEGRIAKFLYERLLSDTPHSLGPEWLEIRKFRDKQFRVSLIKHLSDDFAELLAKGPPYHHEALGEVDFGVIKSEFSPGHKAFAATQHVMQHRFGLFPPSLKTMANLKSLCRTKRQQVPPTLRHQYPT